MYKVRSQKDLIEALERLDKIYEKRTVVERDILSAFMILGVKANLGLDTTAERKDIEEKLALHNIEATEQAVQALKEIDNRKREWYRNRRKSIIEIQRRHGISGLIKTTRRLGIKEFEYLDIIKDLELTDTDLMYLNLAKQNVFKQWEEYISNSDLSIYVSAHPAKKVSIDAVRNSLSQYHWADVSERKYYVSPSRLEKFGEDTPRPEPLYDDDVLQVEVSLYLGTGRYYWETEDSLLFLASN